MWFLLKGSKRFQEEIESWVASGLITPVQAQQLIERYELNQDPPWYKSSSFILRGVALLLAAMGFLLIISANWNEFGIFTRMLMGLLPLAVSYGLALHFLRRDNRQATELSMIFGTFAFGVNIALQAQIFHISAYTPDGLLWWIIGAMPVIFYFRSSLLAMVFQALFICWLSLQNQNEQFSVWAPVLMAGFIMLLYLKPNGVTVLFTFVSLFTFISNLIIILEEKFANRIFIGQMTPLYFGSYILLFVVLFQFIRHQYSEEFAKRFQNILLFVLLFFLYLFTFKAISQEVVEHIDRHGIPISLYALLTVSVIVYMIQRRFQDINLMLGFITVSLFYLPVVFFPEAIGDSGTHSELLGPFVNVYTLIINAVFLAYSIWKIYEGISTHEKQKFMSGIFYLVILAISRYITLFENYLVTALIFIACGIGVYFINLMWDKKYAK